MSSLVSKITEGVVAKITDLALLLLFYQINLGSSQKLSSTDYAMSKAMDTVAEINYRSIKRALAELRRQGIIKRVKASSLEHVITAAGYKRIKSLAPEYQTARVWDGNIYLITYDVPIKRNKDRNLLREYLKKIGCGLLQESMWLTPYNPTRIISDFINERNLQGTILVSTLGKDGSIGNMTLLELVETVYKLRELNERYENFILQYKAGKSITFLYLSILKDDPQLPFELLPEWWRGEQAYNSFKKTVSFQLTDELNLICRSRFGEKPRTFSPRRTS